MAKVKLYGPIWGLNFNWYVYFLYRGNQTKFVISQLKLIWLRGIEKQTYWLNLTLADLV